ncbi:PTS system mannose/fructose/sorbose family transporter subunit IID [Xylocopilactobacillus apicola]|uniref:PTS N-acetylglucosamine transporter subunit IIABC n=1 Tax=Xylocopilactobacillus apicola TaxID=2932184 RepID=A0AAU9D8C3_9LACO|nr:PTS system mannose/fructose/sorbose family transporter subunit IID [Xylocopilactobacillus apicola]BDR57715.1 PTS N-acetylglucosamine transporter subunit IIABC [Xylocopilactobacillus apicola]
MNKEKSLISKKDLVKSWLIWENFPQTCYNYERMMGQAVAHVFVPASRKFYQNDPAKKKEMMKREIEFFNVHVEFGSVIIGMIIAMEEQKAKGKEIPGEFITSLKTSMMGPLSGVGDTIYQGVLIPILLAICIDITLKGTIWGAILYFVLMFAFSWIFSYANFMFGYRAGAEAVMDFLEKGILNKILKGAEVMGCMVMGGLVSSYVKITVPLKIVTSTQTFSIQKQFLDVLMPNILPFCFTLLILFLLKRGWHSLKVIGLIIVIGILGGLFGILGV